jgi:VWFA-related protein
MLQTPRNTVVLICGLALVSQAQQPDPKPEVQSQANRPVAAEASGLIPRSADDRRRASLASHEIVLNVLVKDAAGKPVRGLTESNFTIVDGRAEPIALFRPAQPPHVILLLDAVNGGRWSFSTERKAVEKYPTSRNTSFSFPVSIGWLSPLGIHLNPESQDPKTLLSQIRAASSVHTWEGSDQPTAHEVGGISASASTILPSDMHAETIDLGSSDKNRRFVLSVDALTNLALKEQNAPGRIVVLWLGAGWPTLTGPGFLLDTADKKDRFFARIADLLNDLRESQITLNEVASLELLRESGVSKEDFVPLMAPVTASSQATAANLALPVLAVQSGGEVLNQGKDMSSAIAECLAGIHSWYMMAFQSLPSREPDEYRPLQVTVDRPGVVVRTNAGYYAQP